MFPERENRVATSAAGRLPIRAMWWRRLTRESRMYDIFPPPRRHVTGKEIVGEADIELEAVKLTEDRGYLDKGDAARLYG